MDVLKFGGSSLANGARVRAAAAILAARQENTPTAAVLSAPAKVTDHLVAATEAATRGESVAPQLDAIAAIAHAILADLRAADPSFDASAPSEVLVRETESLRRVLEGVRLLGQCPDAVYARVVSMGERVSVAIMSAWLNAQGTRCDALDPVARLVADGSPREARVDLAASRARFSGDPPAPDTLWLMPGFTAGDREGALVVLGRNGSDYSASVLAACMNAERCEIWTDVDGVYACDPRIVPDAKRLDRLSYQEAMELSYFGAKVLHPKTIAPIAQHHIPCWIKNTGNPEALGTEIGPRRADAEATVKGISSLGAQTMVNVSGPGMKGMVGMAARVFARMAQAGISMSLITQSSSEYSISFCVPTIEAPDAHAALADEFELELANGLLEPVALRDGVAVVSAVGDGMHAVRGVASRFFSALAQANVNIVAIAQGSSERSISAVVEERSAKLAIKAAYQALFDTRLTLDLFVVGVGLVGGEFLAQLEQQIPALRERNIDLRVCGLANSRQQVTAPEGVDLTAWRPAMDASASGFDFDAFCALVAEHHRVNPVLVDCTSSDAIADQYPAFLEAGFHVVTANKKANTGTLAHYAAIRDAAQRRRRRFLYETNVGAGLPVVENLQNLLDAGDALVRFEGILSGSLSYLCGLLDDGVPYAEATKRAREKGFTEPDPRDDLSGMDVARKVLILAREAGLELTLDDVEVEPLYAPGFDDAGDVDTFLTNIAGADAYFAERAEEARGRGAVLRYVGTIADGRCSVGLREVPSDAPLAAVRGGENALSFTTRYYNPRPLVLRGYGAGAAVTAAGLFADVLRCLAWKQEA